MTAAIAASTSASLSVRSAWKRSRKARLFSSRGERRAPVDVEEAQVREQVAGGGPDDRLDRRRRAILGHDDREVALDGLVARHGPGADDRQLAAGQAGDGELGDDDPSSPQVERRDELGMDLAHPPDRAARRPGRSRPVRGGTGSRPWRPRRSPPACPARRRRSSTRPFASSRSYARAGRFQDGGSAAPVSANPRRHHSVGPDAQLPVALADLEDRDVVAAAALVRVDDVEQAADEVLAQDGVARRERVRDGDRLAGGRPLPRRRRAGVTRPAHERRATRLDERVRDDLGTARPRRGPGGSRRGPPCGSGRNGGIGVSGRVGSIVS